MKKINLSDFEAQINKLKINNIQPKYSNKKVDMSLKPDTFEHQNNMEKRYESETKNLEFKTYKVQFYPDDIEKMKKMNEEESLKYMAYLKKNNRYTTIKDEKES